MTRINPKWRARVTAGKVRIEDQARFLVYVGRMEGKEVDVTVAPRRKVRSTGQLNESGNQNGYYWAVVVAMVSDAMGITDDEAHEFLKWQFNRRGVERGGKRWEIPGSTSSLSTAEFADYLEKIRMWAAGSDALSLRIPEPNEAEWG